MLSCLLHTYFCITPQLFSSHQFRQQKNWPSSFCKCYIDLSAWCQFGCWSFSLNVFFFILTIFSRLPWNPKRLKQNISARPQPAVKTLETASVSISDHGCLHDKNYKKYKKSCIHTYIHTRVWLIDQVARNNTILFMCLYYTVLSFLFDVQYVKCFLPYSGA